MNIIVSGWPAAGGTTLAVLLAYLLDYQYLYGGDVMKYLAAQLTGSTTGESLVDFEEQYGTYFDQVWEPYAAWKITRSDTMVLDGKASGFFTNSENVYEIMVIAGSDVRQARVKRDDRMYNVETLQERDNELRERWIAAYGLDIFDPTQIQLNYDLVIDNSRLNIRHELELVLTHLEEDYRFPATDLAHLKEKLPELESNFHRGNKTYFIQELEKRGDIIHRDIVLAEWRKHFANKLAGWPEELKRQLAS